MGKRLVLFLGGKVLLVFAGCMIIPLLLTIYTAKNRLAEFGIPILIALAWDFGSAGARIHIEDG